MIIFFFLYYEVPKEERYQIVSVPNHKQMFETGMMLRNVSHDVIEELAKYLNPVNPSNNWKKVASMLGFSWNLISNLDLKPTTATQELLERWGTKREATVYKLYMILKEIDRDDAAEVLERVLRESSPNFPRSV